MKFSLIQFLKTKKPLTEFFLTFRFLFICLSFLCVFISTSSAQGVLKDRIGAFDLMCETPTGLDREICALVQQVDNSEKQNARLVMTIGYLVDDGNFFMRLTAPLGVYLPGLLSLSIDGQKIGETPFIRCWPNGCMSESILDPNLVNLLSKGNKAKFVIYPSPEEAVNLEFSLQGITAGMKRLKQ